MDLDKKCEMIKSFLMKVYPTIKEVVISNYDGNRKLMVIGLVSTDLDDEFDPSLAKWEICDKVNSFFNTDIGDYFFSEIVVAIKLT